MAQWRPGRLIRVASVTRLAWSCSVPMHPQSVPENDDCPPCMQPNGNWRLLLHRPHGRQRSATSDGDSDWNTHIGTGRSA